MKKIAYLFATVLLFLTIGSCQKPNVLEKGGQEIVETTRTMNDLIVGENFDWKTTKDVTVKLNLSSTGTVYLNSTQGETFQKAFVKGNNEYVTKITIPSYMDKIQVVHSGTIEEIPISDNTIQLSI